MPRHWQGRQQEIPRLMRPPTCSSTGLRTPCQVRPAETDGHTDRQVAQNIHRQRRLCIPCAVCAWGTDCLPRDVFTHPTSAGTEQTLCADSLKSTRSRRIRQGPRPRKWSGSGVDDSAAVVSDSEAQVTYSTMAYAYVWMQVLMHAGICTRIADRYMYWPMYRLIHVPNCAAH